MQFTYYGHSCFGVRVGGKDLLFDPFITPNALAKDIDATSLPADYVLISHGHEDHVADALDIVKRTGATVVSNYEIAVWCNGKGAQNFHPMNHGGSKTFDFGTVKYVSAIHSSMLPDGTYGGNPGGFIVSSPEGRFYYSGDTALTYDMKLIGEFHRPDIALLPVGDNFTMGMDDVIACAGFINCRKIIGLHYDTFPYIVIDKQKTMEKAKAAGIELYLPDIGNTVTM